MWFSWLSFGFSCIGDYTRPLACLDSFGTRRIPRKPQETHQKEVNTLIIAVDFDGILCENDFPNIGKPNYEVISLVRQLIDMGHEVILWTSRTDNRLTEAVVWCGDYGLHFCAVNENAPSNIAKYKNVYPSGTRKVYADVYIDDHNLEFVFDDDGFEWLLKYLRKLIRRRTK
jgi:hypothetical protein